MTSTVNSALSSLADLRQQLFTKSDTDKSGTLSLDEFKKLSEAMKSSGMTPLGGKGQSQESAFAQLDKNGDGQLTATEMEAGAKLADQITAILLQIQEIKNGGMFSSMLDGSGGSNLSSIFGGGDTGSNSLANLLGGSGSGSADPLTTLLQGTTGSNDNSSSGSDQLTSLIQQILANYKQTAEAADSSTAATGSTVSATA